MGVDLGLVRPPCTCTMSYYYATHRIVLNINATPDTHGPGLFVSEGSVERQSTAYNALDMALSRIRAITNPEFLQMMAKCRPPTGWPSTIGP
jgi:hypothetical protein